MAIVLISIPRLKVVSLSLLFHFVCLPFFLPLFLPPGLLLFLLPSRLVSRLPAQTGYRDIFSSRRHISTALVWKGKRHLCSSPVSKLFRKSNISGFDISCPKILLKPTSVKGLMNLAISSSSLLVRLQM